MKKVLLIFLILQTLGYSSLMMMQKSHAGQFDGLTAALPSQIGVWTAEPKDRIYDTDTIFSYIDGAGEVYRAYNMRSCLSRRYSSPNSPTIVLDIFDMGTSEDAFGVFTHDQDGSPVDVGQGGLYRPGWLSFWKGKYFVSIYVEEETAPAKKAMGELAKVVASLIKDQGSGSQTRNTAEFAAGGAAIPKHPIPTPSCTAELSLLSCGRKHSEPRPTHGCCSRSVPAVRKTSPSASCLLPECGPGDRSPQDLAPPLLA